MSIRPHLSTLLRLLLTASAMLAVAVGFAGLTTHLVERRLAALTVGGIDFTRLRYDPFPGVVMLDTVTGTRDDGEPVTVARLYPLDARAERPSIGLGVLFDAVETVARR